MQSREDAPARPLRPEDRPACPACGYRRGELVEGPLGYDCPVCGFGRADFEARTIGETTRRPPTGKGPSRGIGALVAGALAFPTGLGIFFGNPRIKRYLLPPLALAMVVFVVVIAWTRGLLSDFLDQNLGTGDEDVVLDSFDPGWWRSSLEWLLNDAWGLELLRGSSWILFLLLATVLAWYCFSLVYELFAGPFLDEVHGIIEERWFGADPRKALDRPTDLAASICARNCWILGVVGSLAFAFAFWQLTWPWLLLSFALFAAPFLAAMTPSGLPILREGKQFGVWLRWVVSFESRSLWIGLEMSLISLLFMVVFLPLYLVPLFGPFLYSGAVGMGTAIGMLDLPLERRGWSLSQRIALVSRHPLPIMAFGVVTGAAFTVPIIGPMLSVPAASLGAMWLICRLDTGPRGR
ncbi:MAG: EI24 domain-containing protein [Planctomycetota bacterium]|nr:EI24 domain-containing protein [Planctomycetota bacterium]